MDSLKPPPFEYLAPTTLDEAVALRAEHADDCVLLAGGQSLMPLLNLRLARPAAVIDLGRVAELAGIRELDGGLAIGAMTRQRTAELSTLVGERCPLLVQALRYVAHVTIRNRGTIGGSLAHADGAAELPAVALALDAELVARSTRGERTIAASDFFQGFFTTSLEPDELLTEVRFPAPETGTRTAFLEVARRHGDFALVGLAAVGSPSGTRLAFSGVASRPVRADDEEAIAQLVPSDDIHATGAYRLRLAGTLARRALAEVAA
jgi:aerobic carbon-monoxide dehydrogenase medium subunit